MKLLFFKLIYLYLREKEREGERERERERERENPRMLHTANRSKCEAQTHEPRDHDLCQSQVFNQLSHPGAPKMKLLVIQL